MCPLGQVRGEMQKILFPVMVLRHNRPEVPFIPHILSYFVINYKMQPADPPPPSMYTCLLQSGVAAPFIKKWFPLLHFLAPRLVLCDYL